MGDRANVCVTSDEWESKVFLYSHWAGTELPEVTRQALARRQRWGDPAYLARIIFCAMVRGDEEAETGYGISSVVGDGDDRILTVDCDTQEVIWPNGDRTSFAAFVSSGHATWPRVAG